ncbi:TPA: pentapeptide repeat-containing protein [Campylobacter coli]|nr:pentapeptide repeat-containing protein [Campylobacter coli]
MMKKILEILKKCCEKIHQNDKSEYEIRRQLFNILSKNNPNNIKEYDISILNNEEIKDKQDFRQKDELFPVNEKWYLVCGKDDRIIDISLPCDKIKSIPCNVIFNNCNIDLYIDEPKGTKKDNAETIKNHLRFYNCTFEKSLNLKNIIFEKTLTFNQCAFYNDLKIYQNQFLDHLVFINCSNEQNDKKIISLDLQENEFKGYLFIKNYIIEKINLWKNKFKSMCCCVDSKFGYKDKDNQVKLNFSNTHFEDEVYFNNSEFYNYADFHECTFDNIACFYGVKFYKAPNFSQVVLKGNLNALNITSNFVFDDLEKQIDQEYEDFNKDKKEQDKKPLYKFSNDFRDSFRTFKNTLIKDNNLLDASNFHKYELYCKEIELKFKKPKIFSREWIDKWQLFFYRKLCDHHTDFLLNLRWLVVVVGFFVSVLFVLRYGDGNLLQFFNKDNDLLKMLKDMLNIKVLNDSNVTYLILLYSFIGLFFVRTFFIFYYLVIFILMLTISPYNLFSVVNFVAKGKLNSFLENIIMVAYALIMILVLFSLQKTARKNSIVPS